MGCPHWDFRSRDLGEAMSQVVGTEVKGECQYK